MNDQLCGSTNYPNLVLSFLFEFNYGHVNDNHVIFVVDNVLGTKFALSWFL